MRLSKEINILKKSILALSAIVEDSVRKAVESTIQRNADQARGVISDDDRIDELEVDIEEECLKVLALHQPVAIDLRYVVTALKINNDLERIGDHAVNIAESALYLVEHPNIEMPQQLPMMMEKTRIMLHKSVNSLIDSNVELAHQVLALDDEIDELNRDMIHLHKLKMRERPDEMDGYLRLIFVSRNLERIADLATNIAEDVTYLIEGDIVRHGHG